MTRRTIPRPRPDGAMDGGMAHVSTGPTFSSASLDCPATSTSHHSASAKFAATSIRCPAPYWMRFVVNSLTASSKSPTTTPGRPRRRRMSEMNERAARQLEGTRSKDCSTRVADMRDVGPSAALRSITITMYPVEPTSTRRAQVRSGRPISLGVAWLHTKDGSHTAGPGTYPP
jgi:hypothetical protein